MGKEDNLNESSEKPKITTGTLLKILEINLVYNYENHKIIVGPESYTTEMFLGYKTKFDIITDNGENKEFEYNGIILPDSIKNSIEIIDQKNRRRRIHDLDLNRWYN